MGRMYQSDKNCPKCGTRLKLSRMSLRHFCEKCCEFKEIKEKTTMEKILSIGRVRCD